MRPRLRGLLLLFTGQLAHGSSYTCNEIDLKNNGAMCYFKFQCPDLFTSVCIKYGAYGRTQEQRDFFVKYFPACCLEKVVYKRNWRTCHKITRYAKEGRCDPKDHAIVKVEVESRPTTTTTAPLRIHSYGGSGFPSGSSSVSSGQLRACSRMIRSSRYIQRFPYCCQHPVVYNRYKKECAFMRHYKRRKRNADFISRAWDVVDDDDDDDDDDLVSDPDPDVPDTNMKDMAIEVKCCGSSGTELKTCKGAECFYVCDGSSGGAIVDTIDVTSSEDLCNPEITGEGSGGRKKRSASWSAATMASWKVNWCPGKVTAERGWWIRWFKICCFHPAVRGHSFNKNAEKAWKRKAGGVANYCHKKSGGLFSKWEED